MTKSIYTTLVFMFFVTVFKSQTTAMQFSGLNCDGNYVDLFTDLDAGKAVILHFYMPSCGSCPPPAQKIQAMANHINDMYPGMVKGYAFPFQNNTTCSYSSNWVSSNGLSSLYIPMDSGATQVAYYGGFGMPTIVLLGGLDHRVLFSTQSFSTSDTTIMRDSILALFNETMIVNDLPVIVSNFKVFPNPTSDIISIQVSLKETSSVLVDVTDMTGKRVALISNQKESGTMTTTFDTSVLPNGNYFIRSNVNGSVITKKISVTH